MAQCLLSLRFSFINFSRLPSISDPLIMFDTLCHFHLQACYIGAMPANGRAYGYLLAIGAYLVPLSLSFLSFFIDKHPSFHWGKKETK